MPIFVTSLMRKWRESLLITGNLIISPYPYTSPLCSHDRRQTSSSREIITMLNNIIISILSILFFLLSQQCDSFTPPHRGNCRFFLDTADTAEVSCDTRRLAVEHIPIIMREIEKKKKKCPIFSFSIFLTHSGH